MVRRTAYSETYSCPEMQFEMQFELQGARGHVLQWLQCLQFLQCFLQCQS